jgi:DNA-binding response OmpR family regulator
VVVDVASRVVSKNGVAVALTPREYRLLEFLIVRINQPVAKSEILETVWGGSFDGDPNIVEVYVGYLRRKLDRAGAPSLITTLRGIGYTISSL